MTKLIPLTKGKSTAVDAEWYDVLAGHKWLCCNGYAARRIVIDSEMRRHKMVYMHRIITGAHDGVEVDHRDGDKLNNTTANLRIATRRQNAANIPKTIGNISRYKGLYQCKHNGRWRAQICVSRKCIHIGYFADEVVAAKAWDKAAREHFGEFARLNFPNE